MNRPRKLLVTMLIVFAAVGLSSASDIYVAQNAAGGDTGADCADAHSAAWFNQAANWGGGAGKIGPDTTVHLCGSFNGNAGATMLTVQGSGSSGHNIIIQSDSGSPATFAAPYWNASYGAIYCSGQQYIVLDGNGTGLIQNTANGTTLANQQQSLGISNFCSNSTIEKWTITNLYIRTQGSDTDTVESMCIGNNGSNILITSNVLSYCRIGVGFNADTGSTSNFEASFNTISFVDHGITVGSAAKSATLSGALIHDNDIGGGGYVWDGTTSCPWHHDGVHVFFQGGAGDTATGVQIYNNYGHGLWSQANIGGNGCLNAHIYFEGGITDPQVFNNVYELDQGVGNHPDGGFISIRAEIYGTNAEVYNNTIVGNNSSSGNGNCIQVVDEPNFSMENNIFMTAGSGCAILLQGAITAKTIENNLYYQVGSSAWCWQNGMFYSYAQWKGFGLDAHGQNGNNPKLTQSYTLNAGSPAIQQGANLTSLGISALDSDKGGVARPGGTCSGQGSGCNWDEGAYQYSTVLPPAPPTGLAAVVN